jgi:hypothetical protein
LRKFLVLFYFSFSTFTIPCCYGQSWLWAKEGVNNNSNSVCDPYSISTDNKGNVFETGEFSGSVTFGLYTITYSGPSSGPAFLVKFDSNGNALWAVGAQVPNGNDASRGLSVTTDKVGNSYITGFFTDSVAFGSFRLGTKGTDVFLVKFAPNGNVLWAKDSKEISNKNANTAFSVAIDNVGNVYVSGQFGDTISFGSYTAICNGYDVFLVKYDSNGNALWLKNGITSNSLTSSYSYEVATDSNNNVYLTGAFLDTISFGTYKLTTAGAFGSIFLVKYDSNGNVKWAKNSVVPNSMFPFIFNTSYSIVADKSGSIYITGKFVDTITFGAYLLSTNRPYDIFLVKYDSTGNVVWAQSGKSLFEGTGYSLSADKWNHIYLAGSFNDSIAFGSVKLVSTSYLPSCIFEFDTSGNALCGTLINNDNDDADAIAVNPSSPNAYFGGDVEGGACIFGNDTLNGGAIEYLFLAKWQPCGVDASINPVIEKSNISLFPDPNNGLFTLQIKNEEQEIKNIEVYNVMGQKVLAETLRYPQGDNAIDISSQPSGIYLYRILNTDGELLGSGKVVVNKQ